MSAAVMITTTAAVSVANASMSSNTPPWAGAARLRQTTQQLSDPDKFKKLRCHCDGNWPSSDVSRQKSIGINQISKLRNFCNCRVSPYQ